MRKRDSSGKSYAIITGYKSNGKRIWSKKTSTDKQQAVANPFMGIGVYNGYYYYCDNYQLKAIAPKTGKQKWVNKKGRFINSSFCFDYRGRFYTENGWNSGSIIVIDKKGKLIKTIKVDGVDIGLEIDGDNLIARSALPFRTFIIRLSDYEIVSSY